MLGYGEMDDNNAATYTMQGINYNDARKPFLRLRDICHAFIRHLSYGRMTNVVRVNALNFLPFNIYMFKSYLIDY